MELGPTLRALLYNRSRFLLIALEVALTLAIAVNCLHMISGLRTTLHKDSGIDEENVVRVSVRGFGSRTPDDQQAESLRQEDVTLLRALPGVKQATRILEIPLSGGGSSTGRKALGSKLDTSSAPYFGVGPDWLETLGVELSKGRDFLPAEWDLPEDKRPVVLTEALAKSLFQDEDPIGKKITNSKEEDINEVVGLVRHMTNSWPQSQIADHAMFYPDRPWYPGYHYYIVRAEPGRVEEVRDAVSKALLARDSQRSISAETFRTIRDDTFSETRVVITLLLVVILLLLFVTGLGIVGVTSFSVTQRTRQIGTRRALGATQGDVLRYFIVENLLVTSIGLLAGAGLAFLLNAAMMSFADATRLEVSWILLGALLFLALGLLSALFPALRAARVSPVIATRAA